MDPSQATAGRPGDEHMIVSAAIKDNARPTSLTSTSRVPTDYKVDLDRFLVNVTRPYPTMHSFYRPIERFELKDFISRLYNVLMISTFRDGNYDEALIPTDAEFNNVCHYVLQARSHQVYSSFTGRRLSGRIPMPRELKIPRALGCVLAAYGVTRIHDGMILVVPEPWPIPQDSATAITNLVSHAVLEKFSYFLALAEIKKACTLVTPPMHTTGTPAWLLAVTSSAHPKNVAKMAIRRKNVRSVFPDFTPYDALLAVVICNRYHGKIPRPEADFIAAVNDLPDDVQTRVDFCKS